MPSYRKGVGGERELAHLLNSRGFAVMRAPSSGGVLYPLDMIAIKRGVVLAFEVKTWSRKPRLEAASASAFREWCERAGAMGFLGWRARGKWLFLRMGDVLAGSYGDENWISMERFLEAFATDMGG